MAARDRAPRWSECARAADSGSLRNPWVSWGGEHRSTRIRAIRTRGAQTRGPHEIADFVGWETRGPHEACFVGWIGVRDPATLLQPPPERAAPDQPGSLVAIFLHRAAAQPDTRRGRRSQDRGPGTGLPDQGRV